MATVGLLADWIYIKGYLTITQIRKTYACSAFVVQGALMVLLGYTGDATACVAIVTVAVTIGAFPSSGYLVNAMDIAPKYASIVLGISNTFSTIGGIVSPLATGAIVVNSVNFQINCLIQ
jgi:ACS family sodium-dependent inorganic phosphate cotransporter